jgi:opacity protein-like surface antigen
MQNPRTSVAASAAALLLAAAAAPVLAADTAAATPHAIGTNNTNKPATVWGGLGVYRTAISSLTASSTDFGLNGGAGYAIRYTDVLSIMPFANVGVAFASGTRPVPITVGAGARFDSLGPIKVLLGGGLSVMPQVACSSTCNTFVGVGFVGQVFYPVPSLQALGLEGQVAFHILSNSTTEFTVNAGVAYDLF